MIGPYGRFTLEVCNGRSQVLVSYSASRPFLGRLAERQTADSLVAEALQLAFSVQQIRYPSWHGLC
jgi:hypothetical protein